MRRGVKACSSSSQQQPSHCFATHAVWCQWRLWERTGRLLGGLPLLRLLLLCQRCLGLQLCLRLRAQKVLRRQHRLRGRGRWWQGAAVAAKGRLHGLAKGVLLAVDIALSEGERRHWCRGPHREQAILQHNNASVRRGAGRQRHSAHPRTSGCCCPCW